MDNGLMKEENKTVIYTEMRKKYKIRFLKY